MQIRIIAKIYSEPGNVLLSVVVMASLISWKTKAICYFHFQKSVANCCISIRILQCWIL